ncbi:PAS domain-containing protein [Tamlana sp. 62-3]|uniref:histidine kinase n=1 Tax=Neotamlana sargassicola TaxID=2883125 RepID=A0A9X1I8G0_9FLAO|nr:PAS domain-containing protein [Tamlana sargassicola]MCB4809278.1 PAS domain-containing protein [Tamlana sargassicola]
MNQTANLIKNYHKLIVEQAPVSIAMLDTNMVYIAVSNKWCKDYRKENEIIIGRSHYDVFPEIGDDWKEKHKACLNGAIDVCDEAPFVRHDGTVQWIYWDVRPWYNEDDSIGGLLMFTGDITDQYKLKKESDRVKKILDSTNKISKIGIWELDLVTDNYTLNSVAKEILKLPDNYNPKGKDTFNFLSDNYKKRLEEAVKEVIVNKTSFDIELQVETYTGEVIWIRDIGQGEFFNDKCIRLYGCFQDVTHIKEENLKTQKQNEKLNEAQKIAKLGHFSIKIPGGQVVWSDNLYNIMGMSRGVEDISINTVINLTVEEDREKLNKHFEKTLAEKQFGEELVHRVLTPKGDLKYIRVLGEVVTNEDSSITEIIGTCQDITQQRVAELKFKGLLESAPDAMIIANVSGVIQIVNKEAVKLFGYEPHEIEGKPVEILVPDRFLGHHKSLRDGYHKQPKHKQYLQNKDLFGKKKNGEVFPIQISLSPIQTEEGKLVSAAIRDITSQKKAEQEILDKNRMLNFAENLAKMGSWEYNLETNIIKWSNGMYKLLDFEEAGFPITLKYYYSFIHPEYKEYVENEFVNIFKTKSYGDVKEYKVISNTGAIKILQSKGELIKNSDGRIIVIKGTSQDVTKAREIAQEIEKKQEMLTFAEDLAKIGNWQWSAKADVFYWSDGLYNLLELDKATVPKVIDADYYLKFVHPDDLEYVLLEINKLSKTKKKEKVIIYRVITAKGNTIIVETKGKVVFDVNGNIELVKGTMQNVTKEKELELELTKKNDMLNFAEDLAMVGHWQWDVLNKTTQWSNNMYKIFDLKKSIKTIPDGFYFNLIHPDDREYFALNIENAIRLKKFSGTLVYRVITPKGKIKTVHSKGKLITNKKHKLIQIHGTTQDVTKQKKLAEDIIEKNSMLSYAENLALLGNWQWNVQTNSVVWSQGFNNILEIDKPIDNPTFEYYFENFIHPDDKLHFAEYVQETISKKYFGESIEVRVLTTKGKTKVISVIGEVITDENNEVLILKGAAQDITSHKRTEILIKQKNEMLSYAEGLALMGNWHWNVETNDLTWSSGKDKILELKKPLKEKSFEVYLNKFVHPDDKDYVTSRMAQIFQHKTFGEVIEHRIITENKNVKIIHLFGEVVTNTKGEIKFMKGTCQDVTKQYETQKLIEQKNEMLNYAENLALIGNFNWNFIDNTLTWSNGIKKILDINETLDAITLEYYLSFVHPKDYVKVKQRLDEVVKNNLFEKPLQHRIITKKGILKHILIKGKVDSNDGEINCIKGTCQDITQQKEIESKLLEQNRILSSAENLGVMGNWVIHVPKDEMVLSQGLFNILEVTSPPEEISFLNYFLPKFVHPLDRDKILRKFEKTIKDKSIAIESLQHRVITTSGKVKDVIIQGEVILNEKGELDLVRGTMQDVTAQVKEQNRILKINKRLEVLAERLTVQNTQLSDFAQITSHNLRAPVSNLNSLLDVYYDTETKEEKDLVFDKFNIVINHLTLTLNTLVDALKLKNTEVKQELVFFDEMLHQVKQLLSSQISENQVIIKSDFKQQNKILYNKQYFESILLNLVENAIKYRSPDRIPEIKITSELNTNGNLKLIIEDNGLGIDLRRHGNKIFGLNQVFHKHPDAKGIGLFMTKAQIESMGGSIMVSSTVNEGTTFVINFYNAQT